MAKELLGFILLGFSLSIPVGAITIEMIKRGMSGGFLASWFVALGGMSADVVLMLLIYFGVSAFLTGAVAQTILWMIGFIVLMYLGLESIREAFRPVQLEQSGEGKSESLVRCFLSGFAIAISNPLNLIFWLGIYGSVLTSTLQNASGGTVIFYSSAIFIGIAIWDLIIAAAVHYGKNFAGKRFMKVFAIFAGLVLIGFGLSFGWQAFQNIIGRFG